MSGRQRPEPEDRCDECGYAYGVITRAEIPLALRARAVDFRTRLDRLEDEVLRAHPLSGTWSVLEYACHVRDLLQVQRERIELALVADEPRFSPMRREDRVVEERYNEQDPVTVGQELFGSAGRLAATFESLDGQGWSRTGIYNWPSTRVRTVEWIGQHTVHEAQHHLHDVDRLTAL
jgi:S-DNA-T family DNA segregation ATPase FtsK/SpoIIIE